MTDHMTESCFDIAFKLPLAEDGRVHLLDSFYILLFVLIFTLPRVRRIIYCVYTPCMKPGVPTVKVTGHRRAQVNFQKPLEVIPEVITTE